MDLKRIFLKDACPTKTGGQAVMEGIMMKSEFRTAVVVRLPNNEMHIQTRNAKPPASWVRWPILRGVCVFVSSLIDGTKTLMQSADILEKYEENYGDAAGREPGRFEAWLERRFGEGAVWNFMIYSSVLVALVFAVGIFMLLPTWAVDLAKRFTESHIALNLIEGLLRIAMFIAYVLLISRMQDIKTVFRYHGAEHKCIHCFENGLPLTPENCKGFYTLHPRCGTSFLMFVLVISLILFSLLGWPDLLWRIVSRLLLIPVIAGLSYELLKWAGQSDNWLVKVLSIPGLWLQKLTTAEPTEAQLEVAIAAMKAVLVPGETPEYCGICNEEGQLVQSNTRLDL